MAELKKKATRESYGEALAELAEAYPQLVVLDADLSGSTMTKTFAAKYPERRPCCCNKNRYIQEEIP